MSAASREVLPDHYDDLDATLAYVRRYLASGVKNRRLAAHTPTLASIARDGTPAVRTVVLRAVDWSTRTLRIHTDVRARKWAELEARPAVVLHVYDPKAKLQLRVSGEARLASSGADADAAWASSRPSSRTMYGVTEPPGSPVSDPRNVGFDAEDAARTRFGIVLVTVEAIEYLYLAAAGHRRARFTFSPDFSEAATAAWLVP